MGVDFSTTILDATKVAFPKYGRYAYFERGTFVPSKILSI